MSVPIPGKSAWPELLYSPATPAAQTIAQERPDVAVAVLPPGAPVDPDFNPERVYLLIDDDGIVNQIPVIG